MVEKALWPGPELTIQIVGVQAQEQRANRIVGWEVQTATAERAPEQALMLACPHHAAAQRGAAVEHP
jgi:hypothetical protein